MTAIGDLISRADRERLLDRVRELDGLDRLMRERGTLAEPEAPPPLHRSTQPKSAPAETERTPS